MCAFVSNEETKAHFRGTTPIDNKAHSRSYNGGRRPFLQSISILLFGRKLRGEQNALAYRLAPTVDSLKSILRFLAPSQLFF